MIRSYLLLLLASVLGACSSLSGVGGTSKLACPMPDGSTCKPLHAVYEDTQRGTVAYRPEKANDAPSTHSTHVEMGRVPVESTPLPKPLRSSARVLRAWFAPWADSDGDLIGDMRAYLKIDDGGWQLDHVRAGVKQGFVPLRPPLRPLAAVPTTQVTTAQQSPPARPTANQTQGGQGMMSFGSSEEAE